MFKLLIKIEVILNECFYAYVIVSVYLRNSQITKPKKINGKKQNARRKKPFDHWLSGTT